MKNNSIKSIFAIVFSVVLIISLNIAIAEAATGKQGYTIYRDGVLAGFEWHAGIVVEPGYSYSNSIVHIAGSGSNVAYTNFSGFEYAYNYTGIYKPSSITNANRDKVVATARALTGKSITYTALGQMDVKSGVQSNGKSRVEPGDIKSMRCDGVVEYSYERNDVRIYGSNAYWNISVNDNNCLTHHMLTNITPLKQAAFLTLDTTSRTW